MDENAKRIFDEAFATLERVRDIEVTPRAYHDDDGMLTSWSRTMPAKPKPEPVPTLTAADVDRRVAAALAEHHKLWIEIQAQAIAHERKLHRGEIAKLKSELDLRLSALLQATDKLERGIGGDRAAEVIDLPVLPMRSPRRA